MVNVDSTGLFDICRSLDASGNPFTELLMKKPFLLFSIFGVSVFIRNSKCRQLPMDL